MKWNGFSLRDRLRQMWRITLAGFWVLVSYLLWMPGALLTVWRARWFQRWNNFIQRVWARGLLWSLDFEVEVEGLPPEKPFFLVANHLSYVDVLVLGSRLGATFVSKAELGGWPVLGHLAKITGTIFINRESKRDAVRVIGEIDRAVSRGAGVIIFPEGTSSRGDRVYPFRPALLHWAASRNWPVHTATIRYTTQDRLRPPDLAICWWGTMEFAPHLMQLLAARRPRAVVRFHGEPITGEDRGVLAERLYQRLNSHFVPVPQSDA